MLYTLPCSGFKLTASVGIGKDCIGSCKCFHMSYTDSRGNFFLSFLGKKLAFQILKNFLFSCVDCNHIKMYFTKIIQSNQRL
jgi:hypothetical protein